LEVRVAHVDFARRIHSSQVTYIKDPPFELESTRIFDGRISSGDVLTSNRIANQNADDVPSAFVRRDNSRHPWRVNPFIEVPRDDRREMNEPNKWKVRGEGVEEVYMKGSKFPFSSSSKLCHG